MNKYFHIYLLPTDFNILESLAYVLSSMYQFNIGTYMWRYKLIDVYKYKHIRNIEISDQNKYWEYINDESIINVQDLVQLTSINSCILNDTEINNLLILLNAGESKLVESILYNCNLYKSFCLCPINFDICKCNSIAEMHIYNFIKYLQRKNNK